MTLATVGATTAGYDALGNITAKSDVGVYAYDGIAAGPHAVTRAGNVDYAYDLNGNMASSGFVDTGLAHRAFAWSSFDKPTRMENAVTAEASEFAYGPSRARVKQTILDGVTVTKTTIYIGGGFERHAFASGPDELVHYIHAGGQRVAVYTKTDDANPATDKTRWLHSDHLGSIDMVTDEAGLITETRSFDPWGKPREGDWTPAVIEPALAKTPRGFTDHEHIQTVGLIHMNGRVQDPTLGRFISPDPSDALDPGVGFNRYSYVLNNPLSLVDPYGFEVHEFSKEDMRQMRDFWSGVRDEVINDAYETTKLGLEALPASRAALGIYRSFGIDPLPDGPAIEPPANPSREYKAGEWTGFGAGIIGGIKAGIGLAKVGLKYAKKALTKTADDVAEVPVPNPHGSKGKPDHQAKVGELEGKAVTEAIPGEEVAREGRIRGHPTSTRNPDVQIVSTDGKTRKVFEAERHPTHKTNREREEEYKNLGVEQETHGLTDVDTPDQ